MTKGSDLLVAALENEGVDRIFGVPGEENLDVVESLRTSSIELVLTRHEQSAAFMAATHGRLTGRPGSASRPWGRARFNLVTGAAYAQLGAMPMVMITGQKAIMTARQARFQIVDIVATMKPLTKSSRQIVSAASIPTLVRDAAASRRRAARSRPARAAGGHRRRGGLRRCATRAAAPDRPSGCPSGGHRARAAMIRDDRSS